MKYYAEYSPRGFANEVTIHVFNSQSERDTWIAETISNESDEESYSSKIGKLSAKEAYKIIKNGKGDATTEDFSNVEYH